MSSLAPTLVHAGREEAVLFPAARTTRRTWLGIGVVLATLAVAFPWVGASVGLSAAWGLPLALVAGLIARPPRH